MLHGDKGFGLIKIAWEHLIWVMWSKKQLSFKLCKETRLFLAAFGSGRIFEKSFVSTCLVVPF